MKGAVSPNSENTAVGGNGGDSFQLKIIREIPLSNTGEAGDKLTGSASENTSDTVENGNAEDLNSRN